MRIVSLSYPVSAEIAKEAAEPKVAAIGQFDGLHQGHASVLTTAINIARENGVPAALITFYPHPKDVIGKGNYEGYLTPQPDKQRLLEEMGIDILYIVEFNKEFSQISPDTFVEEMLFPLNLQTAVVGFDFRFGHKGAGDAAELQKLGDGKMSVVTVPPFLVDGEKVGSSAIRIALKTGKLSDANRWFGRNYHIRGSVIHGEKRGRKIGFPTANLELTDPYVVPALGVYAVRARMDHQDNWIPGVMNVGVKPTFHEGITKPIFEVHLFDYDGDLYNQFMTVDLVQYIRKEHKFESVQELVEWIQRDADEARKILNASESKF
ncbi:riboflavin biosynthesis protein RibF [Bacillus sp. FJAT-18019]|uniref:Riboflavin biosynthesis protein n=1 Tax=Paenibacillus solani TaxID=1705565 RepID=A0A0M1P651_9BACL|nr:bifunctional riboflavin kinase/FAD synthetase [Paenibacillus solani]KOP67682.1 riboflavin biosynthesis protein RibF [Bacillus sp. FJAT-18019]KOR89963.1 riboflavin biosynthesis protein RibF [Paenibacillus solani]